MLCDDSEYPTIKICDFGLSTLVVDCQLLTDFCGSPIYVAPEVLEHHPYSFEIDIWGFGIIAYIMLLGFPPVPSDSNGNIARILGILHREEYFEEEYFQILPPLKQKFLRGLLNRNVKKRFTIAKAKRFWMVKLNK